MSVGLVELCLHRAWGDNLMMIFLQNNNNLTQFKIVIDTSAKKYKILFTSVNIKSPYLDFVRAAVAGDKSDILTVHHNSYSTTHSI